jgi:hypothetical protein
LIFLLAEHRDSHTISLILACVRVKEASSGKCSLRSEREIWLPDCSSYSLQCFWTELLVRWMKGLVWLSVE